MELSGFYMRSPVFVSLSHNQKQHRHHPNRSSHLRSPRCALGAIAAASHTCHALTALRSARCTFYMYVRITDETKVRVRKMPSTISLHTAHYNLCLSTLPSNTYFHLSAYDPKAPSLANNVPVTHVAQFTNALFHEIALIRLFHFLFLYHQN